MEAAVRERSYRLSTHHGATSDSSFPFLLHFCPFVYTVVIVSMTSAVDRRFAPGDAAPRPRRRDRTIATLQNPRRVVQARHLSGLQIVLRRVFGNRR